MDLRPVLDHLAQLAEHNDRDWFRAHARERKAARGDFEGLVMGLLLALAEEMPGLLDYRPGNLIHGMVRDVSRPHQGGPYHTAFRATLSPWGRTPVPVGCYLHVQPGNAFVGGGLSYSWYREATVAVRDHIADQGDRWERILAEPAFIEAFGTVQGESLKRPPQGYDPFHPQMEWLKHKSWYVAAPLPDELFADSDALLARAAGLCRLTMPLNRFLNEALKDVPAPKW